MNTLEQLVYTLATSKAKKITSQSVNAVADKLGIDRKVAKRAWKNYSQLDVKNQKFSLRLKHGGFVGTTTVARRKSQAQWTRSNVPLKGRRVYFKTAAKIILEIKNTDAKVYEVLKANNVSRDQYYSWLQEMNISGKLLNHLVFNWAKFPKKDVKDIIKYNKYPARFIESTVLESAQLERLGTVMDNYLK